MHKIQRKTIIKYIIMLLLGIFSFFIFYNIYPYSDISPHANAASTLLQSSSEGLINWCAHNYAYPFWHLLYLAIMKCMIPVKQLVGGEEKALYMICAALACVVGIMCTYLACCYVYAKISLEKYCNYAPIFSALLIFTGPYYIKTLNESYYLGQGIVIPWHNPTTIISYPFAILCFGMYYLLASKKLERQDIKRWSVFSLLLLISALAKPSVYQMFIPGMGIFCLVELVSSKGKRFKFCVYSLAAVLPTCVLALIQYGMTIKEPTSVMEDVSGFAIAGIGIEWMKVQKIYSAHPLQSLLLMWIFPIFVILLYVYNGERDVRMSLSLSCAVSGGLQYSFLYLQMRPQTGDFAWGYYVSLGMLFIGCVSFFLQLCEKKRLRLLKCLGVVIYSGHVIYGIIYAIKLTNPEFKYYGPLF